VTESTEGAAAVSAEDEQRADLYLLIARLMYDPPEAELLERIRALEGDGSALGQAISALAQAARESDAGAIDDEYQGLFVRIDHAEFKPYASFAQTGRYYAQPLVRLREDMARLKIQRGGEVREPEDHITPLCEMMAGLILGLFDDTPAPLTKQQAFFARHLDAWAADFFQRLAQCESTPFYAAVAEVAARFLEVERRAFEIAA